jgi:hypothetical protein
MVQLDLEKIGEERERFYSEIMTEFEHVVRSPLSRRERDERLNRLYNEQLEYEKEQLRVIRLEGRRVSNTLGFEKSLRRVNDGFRYLNLLRVEALDILLTIETVQEKIKKYFS